VVLLALSSLGFKLLSRKLKVSRDSFVQATMAAATVVLQGITVPKTEMSWTLVVVQQVDRGECSFKSDEQDTDRRMWGHRWKRNPAG